MEMYEEDFFVDFIHSIEQIMKLRETSKNCFSCIIQCMKDCHPFAPQERGKYCFSTLFSILEHTSVCNQTYFTSLSEV